MGQSWWFLRYPYAIARGVWRLIEEVVRARVLLGNFIARDIKVKYRGTVFGYFWSLLEPLALVLTYWFVFSVVLKRGGNLYALEVAIGVLFYNLFSSIVSQSAVSMLSSASLIRRVYFPRQVLVFGVGGANLVFFALSLLILVPFMVVYRVNPGLNVLLLPLVVLGLVLLSMGIGFVVACANVLYRDVAYVIRVLLRIGLYFCPVIYSVETIPERHRELYLLNPLAYLLSAGKRLLLNRPLEGSAVAMWSCIATVALVFVLGGLIFQRYERRTVKFV